MSDAVPMRLVGGAGVGSGGFVRGGGASYGRWLIPLILKLDLGLLAFVGAVCGV